MSSDPKSASDRIALVVSRFRDCEDDQTIAAVATDDGATHLTYGDLRDVLIGVLETEERLHRISDWHARETRPGGMVGDLCTECGECWPCDTRRMADGSYVDDESFPAASASAQGPEVRLSRVGARGTDALTQMPPVPAGEATRQAHALRNGQRSAEAEAGCTAEVDVARSRAFFPEARDRAQT